MAPPRKSTHSQAELAKMTGVNVKTLREWRDAEGLDLSDLHAVMDRAGKVERDAPPDGSESYSEARRRRAIADADRAEIIAKRESGSVIALADVEELMTRLGAEMRSRLLSWIGTMPPMLEGLDASRIQGVMLEKVTELLTAIHENAPLPK